MLSALRNGAKSTPMRIFLVALAAGFAMWGIDDVFRSVSSNDAAIRAGKVEISATEAAIEFDRTRRNYLPGTNNNEAISQGLLNEVLGGLARRALFTAEADRMNLTVTRDMEKAHLASEPAFQDKTGRFSALRFNSAISRAGLDEASYLNYLRQDLQRTQIFDAMSAGMRYPDALAKTMAAWRIERRVIDYVEIPVDVAGEATPADSDIDSWYNENQDSFNSPDMRRVTAIVLSPDALLDDVNVSEDELKAFYENNIDLYGSPERRVLRQMIFSTAEDAEAAVDAIKGGSSFISVAEAELGLSDEDTMLGSLSREDLSEELVEPVFNADAGVVIGPLTTLLGQHVLIVDEINEGSTSAFDDVKSRIEASLKREGATDLVYARISEVEDSLATGATLEETANVTGAPLVMIEGMDRNGFNIDGDLIDGIAGDTNFRETVWTSPVGEAGLVEETDAETFYVLRVDEEMPSASRPLADVKARVVNDMKTERAIAKARVAAEALADTGDMNAAATAQGRAVVTSPSFRRDGVSFDHEAARLIANKAFRIDVDETDIVETGDAAIVITVKAIEPAQGETLEAEIEIMSTSLSQNIRTDLGAVMTTGLSGLHEVEINPLPVQTLLVGSGQ